MKYLINRNILLGVTGGIAAYKSAELVRRLREAGAIVRVVMTHAAQEFVTPLTFQALSGYPVHTDLFDLQAEAAMGHIELARWADVIVIAPASADFIARLAHGHADDLLTTLCLASTAPIALAPAMNVQMWEDTATCDNLNQLRKRHRLIWGPTAGSQACGDIGLGRMLEPDAIVSKIVELFAHGEMVGLKVVVTAGPTHERIDPVRYITNDSSGKMGYAIASACVAAGAHVTLISGPTQLAVPAGVQCTPVVTGQEMYDAVFSTLSACDILIGVAAVADYRCKEIARSKMVKSNSSLMLELIPNADILADVGALSKKPFLVGFAAQTDKSLEKASEKLTRKNLDMIAVNQVGLPDRGFSSDNNALTVLWRTGQQEFPLMDKPQLAKELVKLITTRYFHHEKNSVKNSG